MKNRSTNNSSKLKNILNKRQDIWADSETDTSSISDNDNHTISSKSSTTSNDENNDLSSKNCCLICSILPNLSKINSCPKHLTLLTTAITPPQVVYMMPSAINHCHCQSRSKRRCRSSSSSSSSSGSRNRRKKRSMTVQSSSDTSSQDDLFFSPDVKSQELANNNKQHRSNRVQLPLSPSLPPSSIINTNMINNHQQQNDKFLLTPFLRRNSNEVEPLLKNNQKKSVQQKLPQTSSPDLIELDSDSSNSPDKNLDRIVHVKDDGEILNNNNKKKIAINMAQATEQMQHQTYTQPIILLERVCLKNINSVYGSSPLKR